MNTVAVNLELNLLLYIIVPKVAIASRVKLSFYRAIILLSHGNSSEGVDWSERVLEELQFVAARLA